MSLYIQDATSRPVWGAGRYRPTVNELDCVGVIVKKFTPSSVVFSLGAAYPKFPGVAATYILKPKDLYDVNINGVRYIGRVSYR